MQPLEYGLALGCEDGLGRGAALGPEASLLRKVADGSGDACGFLAALGADLEVCLHVGRAGAEEEVGELLVGEMGEVVGLH